MMQARRQRVRAAILIGLTVVLGIAAIAIAHVRRVRREAIPSLERADLKKYKVQIDTDRATRRRR